MGKFVVKKKIDLAFLGEGWDSAYIVFTPFTFGDNAQMLTLRKKLLSTENIDEKEAQKITTEVMAFLKSKFVEGKGFDGEKLVDIKENDIDDLPQEIITKVFEALQGSATVVPKG